MTHVIKFNRTEPVLFRFYKMAEVQDWKVEIETVHKKMDIIANIDENHNQSNTEDSGVTQQFHAETITEKLEITGGNDDIDGKDDTIGVENLHKKVGVANWSVHKNHHNLDSKVTTENTNYLDDNTNKTEGLSSSYLETNGVDEEILLRSSPVLNRKRNYAINKGSPESNRNSFISISSDSSSDSPDINRDNRKTSDNALENSKFQTGNVFNFDTVNDKNSPKMNKARKQKAQSFDAAPKTPIMNKKGKSQSFNNEGSPKILRDKLFGGINSPKLFRKLRGNGDESPKIPRSPKISRSPKIHKSPKINRDNTDKVDASPKDKKNMGDRSYSNDSEDLSNEKDDIVGDLKTSKQFDRQINTHQRLSRKTSYVAEEIVNYCVPLVKVEFVGQSSTRKVCF